MIDVVDDIIDRHQGQGDTLISILEDIQDRFSYLSEDAMRHVAARTNKALTDIYGIATFYKYFSLEPKGKHLITCCLGTACHVRGGNTVAQEFTKQLKVSPGKTTPDKEFTLQTVNCMGACALGPVVSADGHYFSKVTSAKVEGIIEKTKKGQLGKEKTNGKKVFSVEVNCPKCYHNLMNNEVKIDDAPSIAVEASFGTTLSPVYFSSLYGSFKLSSEVEIPINAKVDFFCPHCHSELRSGSFCPECNSIMIPLVIKGGGLLQLCTKSGCSGHFLDLF